MLGRKKSFKSRLVLILAVIILVLLALLWWIKFEAEKPTLALSPDDAAVGAMKEIVLTAGDQKSGIRSLSVVLTKDGKDHELIARHFPSAGFIGGGEVHTVTQRFKIDKRKLGISDGPAVLRVSVRDYAWRNWLHGNLARLEKKIRIDTRPPRIAVLSRAHNITQGGAGLVIYKLSEDCPASGVQVGKNFFPGASGYYRDRQIYLAFIALDYRQGSGTKLFVTATDTAGNRARAGFYYHIKRKRFRKDTIRISDSFLQRKMPEFEEYVPHPAGQPLIDMFLAVNGKLRQANYDQLVALGKKSDPHMYWHGIFERLPNSAPRAGFADHRAYLYKGKIVDHQVHLGADLASLANAKVPAANAGRVAFTGRVGIYGNTVVIDHGFGLFSSYSHLSRIDVQAGQMLKKGDILGLTGSTGLAGGDHLHYAMLVHETFVNPIEWWDAAWIKNNITDKLVEVGQPRAKGGASAAKAPEKPPTEKSKKE